MGEKVYFSESAAAAGIFRFARDRYLMKLPFALHLSRPQWMTLSHALFWVGYIVLISLVLTSIFPMGRALLRTSVMAIFHAGTVYANLYYLMPKYFERGDTSPTCSGCWG
ncbi:MAG: hypothetical protein OHK0039_05300 [Bacteroidia bacterium]